MSKKSANQLKELLKTRTMVAGGPLSIGNRSYKQYLMMEGRHEHAGGPLDGAWDLTNSQLLGGRRPVREKSSGVGAGRLAHWLCCINNSSWGR